MEDRTADIVKGKKNFFQKKNQNDVILSNLVAALVLYKFAKICIRFIPLDWKFIIPLWNWFVFFCNSKIFYCHTIATATTRIIFMNILNMCTIYCYHKNLGIYKCMYMYSVSTALTHTHKHTHALTCIWKEVKNLKWIPFLWSNLKLI